MSEVLLLWLATSPAGTELVEANGSGVRLVRCTAREVPSHALVASGLIAVVDDDHPESDALGAVVDEVVRQRDLTGDGLARAAERAKARARTRQRAVDPRVDEANALETLLQWVTIELVACVSGAVLEGDLLESNVRRLVARPGRGADADDLAPSATDTLEMLDTVRESFRRTHEVLQAVRVLSGSDSSNCVGLAPLCQALKCLLQSRAVPIADVALEVEPTCATRLRTGTIVGALVLLVNDVLDRATQGASVRGKRVRIALRAHRVQGAAVVEVEHDLDAGDAYLQARAGLIARVRALLRAEGGEVQLAPAPGATVVRLLLPLAEVSEGESPDPPRRSPASRAN